MASLLAALVWFMPGWLRTSEPREGIVECVSEVFPEAKVEFRKWDGDNVVWALALDSADKESWRFAFQVAMMKPEERENLTIVGHSLGGRITVRILARLAEHGLKIRQAILLGAAIPSDDPDLAKIGRASVLPVLAVCNPDDNVLRYVYATVGGERAVAFGANGTLAPIENVVECVTPEKLTRESRIDGLWAKSAILRDIANHHEKFYLEYVRRILGGEKNSGNVIVPQDFPTVSWTVMDMDVWWTLLDASGGWKLQKNKITGHCRIIDPGRHRKAWGREAEMRSAFEKVVRQIREQNAP